MDTSNIILSMLSPILGMIIPLAFFLAIPMLLISLIYYSRRKKFKKSSYKDVTGKRFFETINNKGNNGEFLIFYALENMGRPVKILANLYIPKDDGSTTEIDLLLIDTTGIYVIESKNYSGWIFGDEKSKNWTQCLPGGNKSRFYNPIWQNNAHISALCKLLKEINKEYMFSYIVFSERCELKKIPFSSEHMKILKRNQLVSKIKEDFEYKDIVFSEEQVINIYEILKKYILAENGIKEKHINNIKKRGNYYDIN